MPHTNTHTARRSGVCVGGQRGVALQEVHQLAEAQAAPQAEDDDDVGVGVGDDYGDGDSAAVEPGQVCCSKWLKM